MPEKIVIPFAVADYTVQFRRPVVKFLGSGWEPVIQAVIDAWEPWQFHLNNVEVRTQGNLSDQGVNFVLPDKGASFFVGPTECRFHKDNAHWGDVEETLKILAAARSAVLNMTEAEITKQAIVIALHFQLTTRSSKAILSSLFSTTLKSLNDHEPSAYATMLRWDNKHLTLDGSANYANGIYMRLAMTFDGSLALEQVARQLYNKELRVFRMLDVEGEMANSFGAALEFAIFNRYLFQHQTPCL